MNPNSLKPIHVMCEKGVTDRQVAVVIRAIEIALKVANVSVPIRNLGRWQTPGFWQNGRLLPYRSAAWYLMVGRLASRDRREIEGSAVFDKLCCEPWQEQEPHYDVLLLKSNLYAGNTNFALGLSQPGLGSIISAYQIFNSSWRLDPHDVLGTVALHEIGHVFGAPDENRRTRLDYSLGPHCLNRCVMRQRLVLDEWQELTRDCFGRGIYCPECAYDIRSHFHQDAAREYRPRRIGVTLARST